MWVEVGVLNARLSRATPAEKLWCREYLSFTNPTARYSGAPEKTQMYNALVDSFPAGFLALVKKAARDAGMEVQLVERRQLPCAVDPSADLAWLRDYQLSAVERSVSAQRGILWLPTGAGKTEIAVGIARRLPCTWLFLVHRAGLMEQTAARYELRSPGLQAGRIGDGLFNVPDDATFIVGTFQTVASLLRKGDARMQDLAERIGGLVVDECHVLPADSFYRTTQKFSRACYRIGLSGTPLARGDKRSLLAIAALGPVIYRIKPEVLITAGVLAKPSIKLIECKQRCLAPTWQGVYGEAIVRSPRRNRLIVEAAKRAKEKGPVLIFVKELTHGRILEKLLWRHGLSSSFVHGEHSTQWRKSAIDSLVAGRIDVLVCSVVLQEGVDIPTLRSVIVGSGGKSVIAALQRIGRGMRVDAATAKTEFDVYDILDMNCGCKAAAKALGTPGLGIHAGCKWLDRHAKERLAAYRNEGHSTVVEQWTAGLVLDPRDIAADRTVIEAEVPPSPSAGVPTRYALRAQVVRTGRIGKLCE